MASSDIEKGGVDPRSSGHSAAAHSPLRASRVANPAALGLFSFASTTFILSMYNIQTRSIKEPNAVVGMAIFCGGLAQFLAGMWDFPRGNVFGATAFASYGAFWMSYATILIPGSGIVDAFGGNEKEFQSAVGIFLLSWFMVSLFLTIGALRKNWGFIFLLAFLTLTFILLAAGEFADSTGTTKAGGVIGVITAFIAYYVGLSELLSGDEMSIIRLPIGIISGKRVD